MTLSTDEFLRRFLLHVLPRSFVRIRSFGFLSHRRRATLLPVCQRLLELPQEPAASAGPAAPSAALWRCPRCGGPMVVMERLSAMQLHFQLARKGPIPDTS